METSLLQACVAFSVSNFFHYFVGKHTAFRNAAYIMKAGDGLAFAAHVPPSPEKIWIGFTDALGLPELREDERFRGKGARDKNYEQLHDIIAAHVKKHPRAYWLERMGRNEVACAPINGVGEVFEDPIVQSLGMLRTVPDPWGGEQQTVGSGVNMSETPAVPPTRAPLAGEHSREVLAEFGFSRETMDELEREGVLGGLVTTRRDREK